MGAVATMALRTAPGFVLGFFVVISTIVAGLAVRPRAARMILPAPVLSYLVAALISGFVYNRSVDSGHTELAIAAAQWIASGFFVMALATILAALLTTSRWLLWRRSRGRTLAQSPDRYRRRAGRDAGDWGEQDPGGTGPRPGPRAGSGPHNFSSGA